MFTAAKIKASRKNGKDFYLEHLSNNDYYSEKSKIIGTWKGSLADEFNLNNQDVIEDVFAAFQQNINPTTNEKLTPRNKADSVRFYDYGCSAQKSVSIMAMFDERLIKAHHHAVDLGMRELERLAAVRVRNGDNANTNNIEYTGNFIYAQYHHDSSRLLDPQLHTHNVIVNVTKTSDGQLKALETLEMARAIREAGKAYQNFLAQECIRLGYKIVYKTDDKGQRTGFEIADVSDDLCERYSKRSREIEDGKQEFFEQNGRMPDYKEVHKITLQTRSKKMLTKTVFKSWNWTVKERNDLTKYSVGTTVFFNRSMRSVAQSGELLTVKAIGVDSILLSNGREMPLDSAADYINVGEPKDLQLSTGDLIRFTVNVKINGVKISNGSLARVGDKPNQFILLGAKEQKVTLPSNFAGFRYGWVSTSHASQGLTRKNVVIAAQKLAKDAFYVALSRGKFNCKLHVPDKEFFKGKLYSIKTERLAIKDLEAQGLLQKCAKEVEQSTTFDKSFLLPANRQPKIIVASKRRKILLKISDRNRIIKLGERYERQRRTHQPIRTTGARGESRGV